MGYFGRDAYRIYNPETHWIYRSWDVFFEEGVRNKTLPPMPDEDRNPSADHIILDNPPTEDSGHNRGLAPTHEQII